jgi:hypothetical protein
MYSLSYRKKLMDILWSDYPVYGLCLVKGKNIWIWKNVLSNLNILET